MTNDGRSVWPTLHDAHRAVLKQLLVKGSQPRVELARALGLSRTSLTRLTRELIDLGFLEEGESQPRASRGRPRELIRLRGGAAHFLGVKLTGDALYAVVTDLGSRVVGRKEVALEARDVASVVGLIAQTARGLLRGRERPSAIGVCLAGDVEIIDGTSYIVGSAFLGWDGPVPLSRLVADATGLPTSVSNDIVALTAAHHWFGAGAGLQSLAVIGIGIGIGIGLVAGDEIVTGARGRAGKIGHIVVDPAHRLRCTLGHRGCVAALVTMPRIAVNAGLPPDAYDEVVLRAGDGDPASTAALADAAMSLGAIVAQYVNILDPERVIITGEATEMMRTARPRFDAMLLDRLDARATRDLDIHVEDFKFDDYAWGAAITAIRDRV